MTLPGYGALGARAITHVPSAPDATNYPPPLDAGVLAPPAADAGLLRVPLASELEELTAAEMESVELVACLDGDASAAAVLLFIRRFKRPPKLPVRIPPEFAGTSPEEMPRSRDELAVERLEEMARPILERHERRVEQEFEDLPTFVRSEFGTLDAYHEGRAMYCAFGITDPVATVFDHLELTRFLGVEVVVRKEMGDKLEAAATALEDAGVASAVAASLQTFGGFSPRLQEGSERLSNHAFGLAVDVNAENNPHIKKPKVIDLIQEITRDPNDPELQDGFDFSALEFDPGVQRSRDAGTRDTRLERIKRIHARSLRASAILQAWLKEQMEFEKQVEDELALLRKGVADLRQMISTGTEAEAEALRDDYANAQAALNMLQQDMEDDVELQRLRALRAAAGRDKASGLLWVDIWADKGLRNLPIDLVVALAQDLRWGEEYDDSKDAMHFELLRGADGGVIVPAGEFRDLRKLLRDAGVE